MPSSFHRLLAIALLSCDFCVADELPAIVEHVASNRTPSATASVPWERYTGDLRSLPIGVFDSGIGGLTVLEAILKLDEHDNATGKPGADGVADFAGERFVYLGDQANMPYGNYSSVGRVDFLRELIVRDGLFLLGDRFHGGDKPPVKAIVIACNTATAYGLADLRAALAKWNVPIPVIGVVEAGGRGVIDALRADTQASTAAVLATVGTCASGAYPRTIATLAGQQGLQAPVVCQQGSVGLAGAIEGNQAFVAPRFEIPRRPYAGEFLDAPFGQLLPLRHELLDAYQFDMESMFTGGSYVVPITKSKPEDIKGWRVGSTENYLRYDVTTLVDEYRRGNGTKPIRTVVLGCTHYPLVAAAIEQQFLRLRDHRDASGAYPYRHLIAERLTLVNPAEYTAKELFRELFLRKLRLPQGGKSVAEADAFYITVGVDGPLPDDVKYGRSPGRFDAVDVRHVSLTSDAGSRTAIDVWRKLLPHVADRLR